MMVLAVSVTSTPNGSLLADAGGAAFGAAGGGGGGPSGVGMAPCANADEATPSASSAASVVARQRQVIEISMKLNQSPRFRLGARRISQIYHAGHAAE
jgi:hypothetical protein